MRKIAYFGFFVLFFPFVSNADSTSTPQTVTYSSNPELSCPANSALGGTKCYCNSGYKVSGAECVKDVPPPPSQNEIYQDIAAAAAFNSDLTCTQLGFFIALDVEMCQKYKTNPNGQWKLIQRPSAVTTLVTNPWAQAGQQTLNLSLASSTQSIPAIVTIPPPPPPPAEPIKTAAPQPTPEPIKEPEEAIVPKKEPVVEKQTPPAPVEITEETTTAPQSTSTSPDAQLASALAAKDLVAMSSALAQLAAASEAAAALAAPPPPEPTPIPHEDILPKNAGPEKPKSVFKKIIDWIFGIF